jgi:hypothetical protein
MNAKSIFAGLALAGGLLSNVANFAAADDKRVIKLDPSKIQLAPKADLAAAEIGSSIKSFDTTPVVYVTIGFVRNVGGQTAPAGRTAKLEGLAMHYNPMTKKFAKSWVVRAQMVLPAMKAGATVQLSTEHSSDADYRLTVTAGDGNAANDTYVLSQQPKKPGI